MTTTEPADRDLIAPLLEAQAHLKAAMASIRKGARAVDAVPAAKRQAEIAEAELAALRGGIRELDGDPTQVQNLYAQLSLRNNQWRQAKAERDRHAELIAAITTFAFARPVPAHERLLRIQELLDNAEAVPATTESGPT
jgi:hypothetical protein